MSEALQELSSYIGEAAGGLVASADIAYGELTLKTDGARVIALLTFLRDDVQCGFVNLVDICGVDWPARAERFDVVYHLLSPYKNTRIRVKVAVREEEMVPSLVDLHPSANWFEREVFDMFGILFSGHPDLRRILTDYGFRGYPLRKDFPTTGYTEVRYDEALKRVVYEPVKLVQEYRQFDFMSPWEGAEYILPGDQKAAK